MCNLKCNLMRASSRKQQLHRYADTQIRRGITATDTVGVWLQIQKPMPLQLQMQMHKSEIRVVGGW